jgi:phage I-like protein
MKGYIILKGGDVEVSGAPEIISVLPLGHVVSSKGEFDVDEESFRQMKAQIAQRGVDLVIDYEHQTLKGVQAPAAGWVKELILKDGSIAARVEWTPAAARYLENKEYRYLSPVITVRKSDGKATGLHSLALTNTPAIEGMTPIVNSINFDEGGQNNMNEFLVKIAQLLGLGEDATEDQVFEALGKVLDEAKALKDAAAANGGSGGGDKGDDKIVANKAVCELLDLKAGAPADEVAAKIMELKGGKINGVNVLEELKALKKQNAERDAKDAVTMALKSGKIAPAQKEWAESYALSDPKGFASFVEKAPQVVPLGEIDLGDEKALKSDKPDEATLLVCKQLGITEEDLKKYGKEC